MNTIRGAELESRELTVQYFLDTSTHTLTDILPAYVQVFNAKSVDPQVEEPSTQL
jgi:hypothetical protein